VDDSGRCDPDAGRPRSSRRRRSGYGTASRKERRQSKGGGPGGIGLARPRVRARVFYRWPTRLISAGVSACKATGHARVS
jgi:hypothetical protein